jgi:hypothetical protein
VVVLVGRKASNLVGVEEAKRKSGLIRWIWLQTLHV